MGLSADPDLVTDEESGVVSPGSCGREIVIGDHVRFCLKAPHEEWDAHESVYKGCAIMWGGWDVLGYTDEDGLT